MPLSEKSKKLDAFLYEFLTSEKENPNDKVLPVDVASDLLQGYRNFADLDLSDNLREFFKQFFEDKTINDLESLKSTNECKRLQKIINDFNIPGIHEDKRAGLLKTASLLLNSLFMQHSFDHFLSQSYKECGVLNLSHQAKLNLVALIADRDNPLKIFEFIKLLQKSLPYARISLETALLDCHLWPLLKKEQKDEKIQKQRHAKLRQIIFNGLQDGKPLTNITAHLDVMASSFFSEIEPTFKAFERIVLLQEYGKEALDDKTNKATPFAETCLKDELSAETFHACLNFMAGIKNIKTSSVMPVPQKIEITDKNKVYELVLLDPNHPRNLYLGEIVKCCLKVGGYSEPCIRDALTKATSGMYVVQEKKSQKICAAAYAFISQTGNLVFDSIDPLHKNLITEYAMITHNLFRRFADQVIEQHPNIDRVCVGTGGLTKICFDLLKEIIQDNGFEKTQQDTYQYHDSEKVFVLKRSSREEERLDALAAGIIKTAALQVDSNGREIMADAIKKAILRNINLNFYKKRDTLLSEYVDFFKKDPIFSKLLSADIDKSIFSNQQILEELIEKVRFFPPFTKLLNNDVDISLLSDLELHNTVYVVRSCSFSLFEWLSNKHTMLLMKPDILEAAFFKAAQDNDRRFIDLALSYGCTPSLYTWLKTLEWSVKSNAETMVEWLIKDQQIDPNQTAEDLLYCSLTQASMKKMFFKLLELGADPNRASSLNIPHDDSVLAQAVRMQYKDIVDILLDKDIDVTSTKSAIALLEAAHTANKDIFNALIAKGVPFNARNNEGEDIYAAAIKGFNFGTASSEDIVDFINMALNYEQTIQAINHAPEPTPIKHIEAEELALFLLNHAETYSEIFELLLKKNPSILKKQDILHAFFMKAGRTDDYRFIELALSYGSTPNTELWVKALQTSISSNSLRMVEWLITEKALDPNSGDSLCLSIICNLDEATSLLLKLRADPNSSSSSMLGPDDSILSMAVRKQNIKIVDTLLAHGADITSPKGTRALLEAARLANKDIFHSLITAGIPLNSVNSQGETIYAAAIEKFNRGGAKIEDIIDFLRMALHYDQKSQALNDLQESKSTPVAEKASAKLAIFLLKYIYVYDEIFELLLEKKPEVLKHPSIPKAFFVRAVNADDKRFIELALKHNVVPHPALWFKSLQASVAAGSLKIVHWLIDDKKMDPNEGDLLSLSIECDNAEITSMLLELGANPNKPSLSMLGPDDSMLAKAVRKKNKNIVDMLLSYNADISAPRGNRALIDAAIMGDKDIFLSLIAAGVPFYAINSQGEDIYAGAIQGLNLGLTKIEDSINFIKMALQYELNILNDQYEPTWLQLNPRSSTELAHFLFTHLDTFDESFKLMLKKNPDILNNPEVLQAFFERACKADDKRFIELALSYGCAVHPKLWLETLENSVLYNSLNMVEWLLNDKNIDPNKTTKDLLYLCLAYDYSKPMFLMLLAAGADPNRSSHLTLAPDDSTLAIAVRKHDKEVIDALLARGADITPPNGNKALIEASKLGDKDIFLRLITAGVPFNAVNSQGENIYEVAITGLNRQNAAGRRNLIDFIKMALHYEQTGDTSNYSKEHVLLQAIKSRHSKLAISLLNQSYFDEIAEDFPSKSQILKIAIDSENVNFIEKFMEHVKYGYEKRFLLEKNDSNETPLMQSLVKKNMAIAHALCDGNLLKGTMIRVAFFQDVFPNNRTQYVAQLLELDKSLLIDILKDNAASAMLEQLIGDPKIDQELFLLKLNFAELHDDTSEEHQDLWQLYHNLERLEQMINEKPANEKRFDGQHEDSSSTKSDAEDHDSQKNAEDRSDLKLIFNTSPKVTRTQKHRRDG